MVLLEDLAPEIGRQFSEHYWLSPPVGQRLLTPSCSRLCVGPDRDVARSGGEDTKREDVNATRQGVGKLRACHNRQEGRSSDATKIHP
jgi:hypothetical protein